MFNFLKRGKDKQQVEEEIIPWGMPVKRKMSKEETARDEEEQRIIEKNNKERRDMYRIAGTERIFNDNDGRRLAIRCEDNSVPNSNPEHPPFSVVVFWGVREIGHVNAFFPATATMQLTEYKVELGYEGRGIASELIGEVEKQARQKQLHEISCSLPPSSADNEEWTTDFFSQHGFSPRGNEMVKTLQPVA